jgi:CBS domain containing-hemolysin-like protein
MSAPVPPEAKSLLSLLDSVRVEQLVQNQKVICLSSTDSPKECVQTLLVHGIHSAPVFDQATKKWLGLFDIRDFAAYSLRHYKVR